MFGGNQDENKCCLIQKCSRVLGPLPHQNVSFAILNHFSRSGDIGSLKGCQPKVEMSPFCSSDFSLLREEKTCCLSCGVVGERRASVGSRWATRGGNARSMASRPSALSTGCPHAPKGARRSAGLVHKSTASAGARGFHPPAATLAAAGLNGRRQGWSGGGL